MSAEGGDVGDYKNVKSCSTCELCTGWKCHANAPRHIDSEGRAVFPIVTKHDWCREHLLDAGKMMHSF